MVRARLIVSVAATLIVAVGCTNSDGKPLPIATYAPSGGAAMMALMPNATLEQVDGCVQLRTDGGDAVLPFFPLPGTTPHKDRIELGGKTVKLGEKASFGGGASLKPPDGSTTPTACSKITRFFIVSSVVPG